MRARRHRTRSTRSSTTSPPGWSRTRICGPSRCSTSSKPLGFEAVVSDPDPPDPGPRAAPGLRDCGRATERANAVIPHPAGEETQWDWLDLPDPPAAWGWGSMAHLLVGSLAHSGRWRGYLSPSMDQPHLVEGLDRITRGLGGVTRQWRFDRMATVCHPGSGRVTATFAGVAKHYGVIDQDLPAAGRAPQRGGGEGQPHRRATLVAHPGRRADRRAGPGRL